MALLGLAACHGVAAAPSASEVPSPSGPDDGHREMLRLVADAGLPSTLGLQRIEQDLGIDMLGRRHCRRAWVLPSGERRVLMFDDLHFDHGGLFFAQWPLQMRQPADVYAEVFLPVRASRGKVLGSDEVLGERPTDLMVEVMTELADGPACLDPAINSEVSSVARAAWVRALGHEQLALDLVGRSRAAAMGMARVRGALAHALHRIATDGLAQGMPRALARSWLERAQRIMPEHASSASALRDLGEDPREPLVVNDPRSLVAWLGEELTFPLREYDPHFARHRPGWANDMQPRSPSLDLVTLGWAALPALIERTAPVVSLRNGSPKLADTAELARTLAGFIARRKFSTDVQMRAWWMRAKSLGEFGSLAADLEELDRQGSFVARVGRLIEIDAPAGLGLVLGAWDTIEAPIRAAILSSAVDMRLASNRAARPQLMRLLARSSRSESLEEAATAFAFLARVGESGWVRAASQRARIELAAPTEASFEHLVQLLVAIVEHDPARGAKLLHAAARGPTPDIAREVAQDVCFDESESPKLVCPRPIARMLDIGHP